jgi:hypothetical protein
MTAQPTPQEGPGHPETRMTEDPEADGSLDDLFLEGGIKSFHIERMDSGHWWFAVYLTNGERYSFNLHSARKIHARWDIE